MLHKAMLPTINMITAPQNFSAALLFAVLAAFGMLLPENVVAKGFVL